MRIRPEDASQGVQQWVVLLCLKVRLPSEAFVVLSGWQSGFAGDWLLVETCYAWQMRQSLALQMRSLASCAQSQSSVQLRDSHLHRQQEVTKFYCKGNCSAFSMSQKLYEVVGMQHDLRLLTLGEPGIPEGIS